MFLKPLSIFLCVLGFLMPLLLYLYLFLFRLSPVQELSFIYLSYPFWIFPSLLLWILSIVLWKDKGLYWIIWMLLAINIPLAALGWFLFIASQH